MKKKTYLFKYKKKIYPYDICQGFEKNFHHDYFYRMKNLFMYKKEMEIRNCSIVKATFCM